MKSFLLVTIAFMFTSAIPYPAQAEGVSIRGGANSVGDELFDDYENEGVVVLTPGQLEEIARPVFENLARKLPPSSGRNFVRLLKQGLDGMTWYLDPKPLSQTGRCQNQSVLSVEKIVRACQSKLAVRIDRDFYEKNPSIRMALIIHELLVHIQIQSLGASVIEDEGVREASRLIRDLNTPARVLKKRLKAAGFGTYPTAEDLKAAKIEKERRDKASAEWEIWRRKTCMEVTRRGEHDPLLCGHPSNWRTRSHEE